MAKTNINPTELWKEIQKLKIKPDQKLIQTKDYYDMNRPQTKVSCFDPIDSTTIVVSNPSNSRNDPNVSNFFNASNSRSKA